MKALALPLAAVLALAHPTPVAAAVHDDPRCHDAVNFLWPAQSRAWANRIVHRESRGVPTAQNRRSTASGCFQLLAVHADRFAHFGLTWADRYNPIANTLAAADLYREQGPTPWKAT